MQGKIINDPVYGFIKFSQKELMKLIEHPWFQRLRHIKQMGMAHYVYPGAVHTRFHHSLGAAHLMHNALQVLQSKGIDLTPEDCISACQAILLHDIGHGPFSHALEHTLVHDVSHEDISRLIIQQLDVEGLQLQKAAAVFDGSHPLHFLHQLVSSQLDMDRMDYLNRDSFYTGVSEGVIGYDRILQMLNVQDGALAVEAKGVHSIEKFIIARRLMYWQVYLHKTVLSAELLIVNILTRAKELATQGEALFATPALSFFLYEQIGKVEFSSDKEVLATFCRLDDSDIYAAIKVWTSHRDAVLSRLCSMLVSRSLYKIIMTNDRQELLLKEKQQAFLKREKVPKAFLKYFVFEGKAQNATYNRDDDRINILMKDGSIRNITDVDNALISSGLTVPVEKHFVAFVV